MIENAKKIFGKVKGAAFADPYVLYKKEKHLLNQPFFFQGNNGKSILLIHGWTTTPYELRRLGTYLNKNGYTVYAPMLSGHGTTSNDLEDVRWTDWVYDVEIAYEKLAKENEKVFVVGTSIGASLALILAKKHPELSGIVLMATPYKLRLEKIVEFFITIESKFRKYRKKFYPPTFGKRETITRLISYQTYPIKNVLEAAEVVREARRNLNLVKQPCLLMQSTSDHIVCRKSMEKIYIQISSKIKDMKYIKRAYHTFISDIKNEYVFDDILDFLNRCT
ncbi:MAG: lipase/esterase Est [Candidatus Moranbacteria bacterium GW2011_GWE2_35_2-]|nr:MAG: lipase/esterase Est [Candidatus Moranbacteria bacterium GW2011_GWE2_35_2-]KKQ22546.1 MAG: lipase/esterase Est [Candidatus Moranbacteria bacterium GW2011_GWF2_37_11]KKQ29615.1 MAG: lipase/esterase Est [Candidatus Moranbacteria bacterium GW2011_GWD1_37_17]KKQ30515.1 MAG: lipase/esterase Est [Candidatus Moranbacteria bacterium GW2011_GWE1_37_24]KKQ46642.1 MAG: lipase/esterase Est [Candidatus Moranbacteria bacterium GW2011_GWD2_37_9]HBO16532.1 hypothetical protein [Candidatus Moranbacteria